MKYFLTFIFSFFLLTTNGQKKHLEFLGVPIAGSISQMKEKLISKGFISCSTAKFKNYKCKTVNGDWWWFKNCKISIRQHSKATETSSIFIHPTTGYNKINDLVDAYDKKYGIHNVYIDPQTERDFCYTWFVDNGIIQIYGSTIFGQIFNIVYRDYVEEEILDNIDKHMDSEL